MAYIWELINSNKFTAKGVDFVIVATYHKDGEYWCSVKNSGSGAVKEIEYRKLAAYLESL